MTDPLIKTISEKNSFFAKRTIRSIAKYKECLDKFSKNFDNQISLKTDTIIFVDTNVLLRYYIISFTAREKLYHFFSENKKRIVLTSQVQIEFLRNREDIIQQFFEQVTSKIPKDFSSDIVNKMRNFLNQYKTVLKDYPFVEPGIEKHQSDLENLLKKLNEAVGLKRDEHFNLIEKDELLNFLANCYQCEELTIDEIGIVKKHFELLVANIKSENIESLVSKSNNVFPGLGDVKNKSEEAYGDYIIFHEIMKYMMNKKSDAIFLTFDNSKGDWMNKNKSPHLNYIQNVYANTGQILYIVDAERALGKLLDISINSLVSDDSSLKNNTFKTFYKPNIFTYPGNDPDGSPIVFANLINDVSKIKILVLYNDDVAQKAKEFIIKMVTAHPRDYISVVFLFVTQPLLIIGDLKNLDVILSDPEHSLNWDIYSSYRIFSISATNKLISDAITVSDLGRGYGLIKDAIFYALDNG